MSYILKQNNLYQEIKSNYTMDHADGHVNSLRDLLDMPKNKSILVIMDEAYEDIDARLWQDKNVMAFSKAFQQIRKRGQKDTDLWLIVQDFESMVERRIRYSTTSIIEPSIIQWDLETDEPLYMHVKYSRYSPLEGLTNTKEFVLFVKPFLNMYDTNEIVTKRESIDPLEQFIDIYKDDPRSLDLTKTELKDIIFYEQKYNENFPITKTDAQTIANIVSAFIKTSK